MTSHSHSQSTKVWQSWLGSHTFCCDGRLMFGPDSGVTLFAALLTLSISVVFWVWVCPSLHVLATVGGVALYVVNALFMAVTATTDPGIIPRNTTMDDAEAAANSQSTRTQTVNGTVINLKWCYTCRIWRPPRAAHCSECNVCVERLDHHCPWMGQCIGRRNYRFFLGYITSTCLLCTYTCGLSLLVFVHSARHSRAKLMLDVIVEGTVQAPAAAVAVGLPALIVLCVAPLLCYHTTLVCENKTTNEEIKSPYGRHNPFSRGWGRNCDEACCAEREHSRIHLRALACEAQSSTAWRTEEVCEVAPPLVAAGSDVDVDV